MLLWNTIEGWMTTVVEARLPGTKGKLLRLGDPQRVGWGMDDHRGRGAAASNRSRRSGPRPRARFCGSRASSRWVGG